MALADDFDDAVIGRGLPPKAEAALAEAGARRANDPPGAMAALMRAQALAPGHPAVLIALYRHHFFGHRHAPARDIARRGLVVAAQALDLPVAWRDVPRRALPNARTDARTRFYLFLLKGYAYLSLRLGDDTEARDALSLLAALDPDDRVGGSVIEAVRVRALVGAEDLEDTRALPFATGAAAWARARRGGLAEA